MQGILSLNSVIFLLSKYVDTPNLSSQICEMRLAWAAGTCKQFVNVNIAVLPLYDPFNLTVPALVAECVYLHRCNFCVFVKKLSPMENMPI